MGGRGASSSGGGGGRKPSFAEYKAQQKAVSAAQGALSRARRNEIITRVSIEKYFQLSQSERNRFDAAHKKAFEALERAEARYNDARQKLENMERRLQAGRRNRQEDIPF